MHQLSSAAFTWLQTSGPNTRGGRSKMDDIRRAFEKYDQDGNGFISLAEAHHVLHSELGFSPEETQRLIKVYDRNFDGRLSYEEFIWFYWKVQEKNEEIKDVFQKFDVDGSNSISFTEAREMLRDLDFTDRELDDMIQIHDTNNDGVLQYEEFVMFWKSLAGKKPCCTK